MQPNTDTNAPQSVIKFGGITYRHGSNKQFEYFCHLDSYAVLWQVSRDLREIENVQWSASVHHLEREGLDLILMQGENLPELFEQLSEFIKLSHWCRQKVYPISADKPHITIKSVECTTLELKVRCQGCGECETVRVEAADYLLFLKAAAPVHETFPRATLSQRKLLSRGDCSSCWRAIFEEASTRERKRIKTLAG